MAYKYESKRLNGGNPAVMDCTALDTITAGDVVKVDLGTGYVEVVAADGTQALGWALNSASASGAVDVVLALPDQGMWMPITGAAWAATMMGHLYALAGTTGAQYLDLSDTSHDLLKVWEYDSTTTCVFVTIPATKSEAVEVEPI